MDEIWKDIKGYEGLYQVSNWGRIKSIRFGKERIMKLCPDRYGYLYIVLYKNNIKKAYRVHRLVAEAFIDNTDNLPCVNHKDENKQNNNVENLEWCDAKYNLNYGTRNERISKNRDISKQSKPVLQYTLDGQFVREWLSAKQAEIEGGFNQGNICMCCRGKRKYHHNFIWRYK